MKLHRLRPPFNAKEAKEYADRTNAELKKAKTGRKASKSAPKGFKSVKVSLRKRAREVLAEMQRKVNEAHSHRGGLVVPRSDCCNATIIDCPGGLRAPICSRCRKIIEEPRYK